MTEDDTDETTSSQPPTQHHFAPENIRRIRPEAVEAVIRPGRSTVREPSAADVESARRALERRRRRWWILGVVLVVLAGAMVSVSLLAGPVSRHLPWANPQASNPFDGRELAVVPHSQAALAAESARSAGNNPDAAALERLAAVPTAVWLTPEAYGTDAVAGRVRPLAEQADESDEVVVFVVYGVTDRDCSSAESAGGLPADQYVPWVGAIASAMASADGHAVAIVEPDGLASSFDCPDIADQRVDLIAAAVGTLTDAGVPTYVDAGHSDWRGVSEMAQLLESVGIDRARGFSTNVSAYQPDADERAYAEELSAALDGAAYVVDTGRNGGADLSGDAWCNPEPVPPFGETPAVVDDGSHQDARLWIKPPGESDGSGADCAYGPAAGTFWSERALAMAAASGWM